jgi:peptide/nickel transport system substrate-binding protein
MPSSAERQLVVALNYDARLFNEVYRNWLGHGGYFVCNNLFNRLVVLDIFGEGGVSPDLAERWEILDGGAAYRFHLRRAAVWHDGAPVVARDVAITYGTALERGYAAAPWLDDIRAIDVLDDHTVELRLHAPNGGFLARLGMFVYTSILPAHRYEGTDWESNPANLTPVGTGPYQFHTWERGARIETVANPRYFKGRPAIDRLTFTVVSDGPEAFEQLKRGEVDFCTRYAACQDLDDLAVSPGVGVFVDPGNALAHIGFNVRRHPWSDQRVREAVARAVDRTALRDTVCSRALVVDQPYLPHIRWISDPSIRLPAHDLAEAEALLQAAGLQRGPDGVRIRARVATRAAWHYWARAARLLGEQLQPLGIELDVVQLSPTEWEAQITAARDFDFMVESGDIGPDPSFLQLVLGSTGSRNVLGYANPEVDRLLEAGRAAVEPAVRAPSYQQALRILAHELPRVPLLQHPIHVGYRTAWAGWSWDDSVRGTLPFWSFEQVRPRTNAARQTVTGAEAGRSDAAGHGGA